ncbi:NTP transferase domain-containing protein [Prescottella equi]|nr:glycosyltransferase [Prescottella equi]UNQ39110.1 NTP transferase domain-containing protein [Prescottella equi]
MSRLAIIPARGGSRGVRHKNLRLLGGKPLIAHTVEAAISSRVFSRIVVSTDDAAISRWAHEFGVEVHARSAHAASDAATIADVAVEVVEELKWDGDLVAVLQPTSPFRTGRSIEGAMAAFTAGQYQSMMSVVRQEHLYWLDEGDSKTPLFAERVNRQYGRHQVLLETGAIQFVATEALLRSRTIVQKSHGLFEMSPSESLDIDTPEDLAVARFRYEAQGLVVFRVTANRVVGTGHLYHCLQLAQELDSLNVVFLLRQCDEFVGELLESEGYDFVVESDLDADLKALAAGFDRRVLINDILDTTVDDVLVPKLQRYSVVCVEDLGAGIQYADVVVNALYPAREAGGRAVQLVGPDYAVLRPEFYASTRSDWVEHKRVLVTFGGSDPARLTEKLVPALRESLPEAYELTVILGIAAPDVDLPGDIRLVRNPASMAAEMASADVVVTSAGRTVFEAAAVGTPVVVVAQNAREATHSHLSYDQGSIFLGLGSLVSPSAVAGTVEGLLANVALRQEISRRLLDSIPRDGAQSIAGHVRKLLSSEECK